MNAPMKFTLKAGSWYAAEIIGDEFEEHIRSCSPIRVESLQLVGNRSFEVRFYHASYPEGVRDKTYRLQTIERATHFTLCRSMGAPHRLLLIFPITSDWLNRHFNVSIAPGESVADWLDRNA